VFLGWVIAQWVVRSLRGHSVRLPIRKSIAFAAKRRTEARQDVIRWIFMLALTLPFAGVMLREFWIFVTGVLAYGWIVMNLFVAWSIGRLQRFPEEAIQPESHLPGTG
jgi:hypothetical protein